MKKEIAILMADEGLPTLEPGKETLNLLFEIFFKDTQFTPHFYDILHDKWPNKNDYEAYLITGSKYSVLDETPWMKKLEAFIQAKTYKKLIGICFGHQIIAKALGGQVAHGEWHIGVYPIHYTKGPEIEPTQSPLTVRFNHQDHVAQLPKGVAAHYTSSQSKITAFYVDDQILAVQYHPEFTETFHTLLLERLKKNLNEEVYQKALETIDKPTNHNLCLQQILFFLEN